MTKNKMANKWICIFFSILILSVLLLMPLVSSVDTPIKIINLGSKESFIFRIQDHYSNETLERLEINSDDNGEYSYPLSTNSSMQRLNFKLMLIENQKITNTKYLEGGYFTGKAITLDYKSDNSGEATTQANATTPANTTAPANTTTVQANTTQANLTSESSSNSSSILTGKTIINLKEIFLKTKYYIFGVIGVLILGFIAFMIVKKRKALKMSFGNMHLFKGRDDYAKRLGSEIKPLPYSISSKDSSNPRIINAEKKIKELQNEILKLKKEQVIQEAERKIEQDKQELEKLRRSTGFYK